MKRSWPEAIELVVELICIVALCMPHFTHEATGTVAMAAIHGGILIGLLWRRACDYYHSLDENSK